MQLMQKDNISYLYQHPTAIIMNTRTCSHYCDTDTEHQVERSEAVYAIDKIFSMETEDEQNIRQLYIIKTFLTDDVFTSRLEKYDQGALVNYIAKCLQENNYDDQFVNRFSWFLHMLDLTDERELKYYIERFTTAIYE